jgi:hypothetical protein
MKNSKNIKTMAIIGIVLFSVFAATMPTTSAASLVGLSSLVNVEWGNATDQPIVPRQDLVQLDLDIDYTVTKGWFLANFVYNFYIGRQVNIKLDILEYPSWCEASISQGTLTTTVPRDSSVPQSLSTKIIISVDPDAPAFAQGKISVKATVDKVGPIDGYEQTFDLPFQPDYLPLVQPELPDTNTKRIGPMDTAVFPIEVTNLGNARTKVFLEVTHAPDGWIAVVTDTIILDEGEDSKNTAYLTIRPPKSFGYHDDDASIKVKITPAYADDTTLQGNTESLTVIVESRGISVIGIELILPIIILIIVILVIIYLVIKRSKEK